ncbi:MAG: DUF2892 domain-containing protein [Bacteroidetes bacterium]|nr:DUF2892 domain-containing protein [Bacteroidota bacterium]
MKKNMGTIDRILRVIVAVVIAVLYFTNVISGTVAIVLLALAAIFILTSLISFCPLYLPLGLSTIRKKLSSSEKEK